MNPVPPKAEGFGFLPGESEHHFRVTIPDGNRDPVLVSEHLTWEENPERRRLHLALGGEDDKVRVILAREKWNRIAEEVRIAFNTRLRRQGLRAGHWRSGDNILSRLLGKELVVLAWAIEEADPALIPVALRNWSGLAPEERWWLFTMTNAATGHAIAGRGRGWRRALRYALTENPVSDQPATPVTEFFQLLHERSGEASPVPHPPPGGPQSYSEPVQAPKRKAPRRTATPRRPAPAVNKS